MWDMDYYIGRGVYKSHFYSPVCGNIYIVIHLYFITSSTGIAT